MLQVRETEKEIILFQTLPLIGLKWASVGDEHLLE